MFVTPQAWLLGLNIAEIELVGDGRDAKDLK
jgi:hypothetical protein